MISIFPQAICYGFPLLNFMWVLDSVNQKRLRDENSYRLPAGFSDVTKNLVEKYGRRGDLTKLFKGQNILLTSESQVRSLCIGINVHRMNEIFQK